MYTPEIYKNENKQAVENFIHENGFGLLINYSNQKLCATHIPLVLRTTNIGTQILEGHVSIDNPQGKNFVNDEMVLVVFSGANAYISSSWYDHENVPTWNYEAVHVYGKIKILDYKEALLSLKTLVDKYEINSQNPIRIEDLSKKTMLQARGIIGFNIEITAIESTKKLSQNRDEKNYKNIIKELEKTKKANELQVAVAMKKCPF